VKLSAEGLSKIAAWEGCVLHLYDDPAGYCTIGYGHLVHKGRTGTNATAEAPFAAGLTAAGALDLFRVDLAKFEDAVSRIVRVPLAAHQFDALVCLAFNIGITAFAMSSIARYLNQRGTDPEQIKAYWCLWRRAGGQQNAGLLARRRAEVQSFLGATP
jgi:lysozyme